jgi:glutaredoxin
MIKIYGKPDCIQCKSALSLLERKEIPHQYVELSTSDSIQQFLKIYPHVNKMPYILKDDQVIGGYKELHQGIFALGTIK